MKILITGSSGFIGSEVVSALSGHDVVKYDIQDGNDLLDFENLSKMMVGCDVVVHIAAIPAPKIEKSFDDYFQINCVATYNVAKAALQCGIKRLVFTSSTSYYGVERGIPFDTPIVELNSILTQRVKVADLDCRDCDVSYSTSKVIAEQILANYGLRKKFEVVILRLGPTRPRGVDRSFLGIQLKIENAVQAIVKAIEFEKELWYEAFTITNDLEVVDLSRARSLLGYDPI